MRLATQLRRSLFALPLLAVAVLAHPSVSRPDSATIVANGLGCGRAEPVGMLGLARIPGDLGHFGRRLRCGR